MHSDMTMEQTEGQTADGVIILGGIKDSSAKNDSPETIPRHWEILGPSTFTGYRGFNLKNMIN